MSFDRDLGFSDFASRAAKISWALFAFFAGILLVLVVDDKGRMRTAWWEFLALSLLCCGLFTVSLWTTIKARKQDQASRNFVRTMRGKVLNFAPLRMLVVAVVLVLSFAIGRFIGDSVVHQVLPLLPMFMRHVAFQLLVIVPVGVMLGTLETKYLWARLIDGVSQVPGPATIGVCAGYLTWFTWLYPAIDHIFPH